MRIGIDGRYIQDHFPGIGRYAYNLAAKAPEVAPDAEFVVFHNPALLNTRYELEKLARHPNLQLVATDTPTRSIKEQYQLRSLAGSHALDVLHSPYYIKPYSLPCPSVVTMYDLIPVIYPRYLPHRWSTWIFRVTARLAVRSSSRIIAISESTKRDLSRFFVGSRGKTTVVYLAADERFHPLSGASLEETLHRLRLPKKYILYMGINKPHKNLAFLLRVFAEVSTDAKLVLAGKEDRRYSRLRKESQRLGLEDRVVFLGEVADSDLPMLYNGAELLVFPSLYEGFGLPVLEAMACGTPVMCSGASSLPEIVGDAAVTLDPRDAAAWAQGIGELLEDEDLREELSKKGLERAGQFRWEDTARETVGIYRSILSR